MVLRGTLPLGGWDLPRSLEVLDLSYNDLRGTLPPLPLPPLLEELFLHSNKLAGTIPSQWRLPPRLQRLTLDINLLSGAPGWAAEQCFLCARQPAVQRDNDTAVGSLRCSAALPLDAPLLAHRRRAALLAQPQRLESERAVEK